MSHSMFGFYDVLLLVVVCTQVTILTYLRQPKCKAFIISLPIPFTCATLALGQRIDASNVLAMVVVLGYYHGVRLLYHKLGMPIVIAIASSAFGYCVVGWSTARYISAGNIVFWISCAAVMLLATYVLMKQPRRDEPGHRTPLPVWIKLPIVVAITLILIVTKHYLRGFMTVFPIVSVFAAYEARHSLWTMSRQIPIVMFAMIPLMVVSRYTEGPVGLPTSLALGWFALLSVLLPVTRVMWNANGKKGPRVMT